MYTFFTPTSPDGAGESERAKLIHSKLEEIFPDNRIAPDAIVGDPPIGKRQMVEVARAFTVTKAPLRLVILDEPTSSLDSHRSGQLLSHVRRVVAAGASCILISHLLGEILEHSDRIVVMRDGLVVASDRAAHFDRSKLVTAMGGAAARRMQLVEEITGPRGTSAVRVRARPATQSDGIHLVAHEGEIVGLAGLSGHGQTEILLSIFSGSTRHMPGIRVTDRVALIAGDRQSDGIFPLWSIAKNIGIGSLAALRSGYLLSSELEDRLAELWQKRIRIRTPNMRNNILSLSGGNQQKALFARALGSEANIVVMDDPMRGVDVNTKLEVYELIRAEAHAGRTFLWYTTEIEELQNCDHIYVFRSGRIVAGLRRGELSEELVIQSSFQEGTTT